MRYVLLLLGFWLTTDIVAQSNPFTIEPKAGIVYAISKTNEVYDFSYSGAFLCSHQIGFLKPSVGLQYATYNFHINYGTNALGLIKNEYKVNTLSIPVQVVFGNLKKEQFVTINYLLGVSLNKIVSSKVYVYYTDAVTQEYNTNNPEAFLSFKSGLVLSKNFNESISFELIPFIAYSLGKTAAESDPRYVGYATPYKDFSVGCEFGIGYTF